MLSRFIVRRVIAGLVVLFAITYFAFFAQNVAAGQRGLQPSPLATVAQNSWDQTLQMWQGIPTGNLGTYSVSGYYFGALENLPIIGLVKSAFWNSSVLLLLAMALAGVVGGLLGIGFAAFRRKSVSLSMLLLSIIGVSTPSFFLAVLLQFAAIEFYKRTGTRLVPVGGFGWDDHVVLPVLVLAARPIAQVARLTSVYMQNLVDQDFVRTAKSKGLSSYQVWFGHIIPNTAGTALAALSTSVRFALSSLPVIEVFFGWPGLGRNLLERLESGDTQTVAALVLATGLFFVLVDGVVDLLHRVVDPQLRKAETVASAQMESGNWLEMAWTGFLGAITLRGLRQRRQKRHELAPLPVDARVAEESESEMSRLAHSMRWGRIRAWQRATIGNPALSVGFVLGIALLLVVLAGPQLAPYNPYYTHTSIEVAGQMVTPPVAPSAQYPLGTDAQGRDILSLLLVGARRTMMLAVIAVAVRLIIGGVFGFLAGWFHDTLLDRALMSIGEVVNSFPALLLATLVVYAVGIRQGLYAFIFGLMVIGWPEVMQNVRAQVMSVRPLAYIEGAVASGAGQAQILTRHILPNIWPTMVSIAFLEMGGALMILGELGFLGVFIGGGFAASGEARPSIYYYDIPEWGVMLANSWQSFRSHPWAMAYPALAFLVAIVAFTLLGEGLRRMAEELTLSMKTLFNRYTFLAAVVVVGLVAWTMQSTSIWAQYKPLATTFDSQRAMDTVTTLADPQFEGRMVGTQGAEDAADWIASQFESLGLVTGGEDWTYFQTIRTRIPSLEQPAQLQMLSAEGTPTAFAWGTDYVEPQLQYIRPAADIEENVVYANVDPSVERSALAVRTALGISDQEASRTDKILLVELDDVWITDPATLVYSPSPLTPVSASMVLVINDNPETYVQRELPGVSLPLGSSPRSMQAPTLYVTSEVAEKLLAQSGYSLKELRSRKASVTGNQGVYVQTTTQVKAHFAAVENKDISYRNVIAMWPGEDVAMDAEMVVIMANYDGLGQFGTLYPGANDNASGIATMLELIRSWKEWGFKPKRTVLFVAWAGGELHNSPSISQYVTTRPGLDTLDVIASFELEGLGAGSGDAPLMWRSTSDRVSEMVQSAARQLGLPLTTKGAGLHATQQLTSAMHTNYPTMILSWPGADATAHLPTDTPDTLDPSKMQKAGEILSLVSAVLLSDTAY